MHDVDTVGALSRALEGRRDVRVAVLFGSRARGTHRPDSDVDVAVLAPAVDLLRLRADLDLALGREVDVVSLVDPGVPLLESIVADGIMLHEGVRGAYALWRSGALATLETDRPWFARMARSTLARLAAGRR